jgi:preprotein translocase subunit SecD
VRALMIAAVAVIAVAATACTSSSAPPPPVSSPAGPPIVRVTCTSPDGTAVAGDGPSVRARAAHIGATVVAVQSAAATLQIDVRGVSTDRARTLCASPAVELRGLVAPGVHVTCSGQQCTADSVSAVLKSERLDPPPLTEASYSALSAAQQRRLAAALARFDCASVGREGDDRSSYFVSCEHDVALYLGPVIVSGADVADATAVAPSRTNAGWSVALSFTRQGSAAWAQYTGAHNLNGTTPQADETQCSVATMPCAVFVAFVLDGVTISVPYNAQAITAGTTEISASFGAAAAKQLAGQLSSALPVPLRVGSVQTLR